MTAAIASHDHLFLLSEDDWDDQVLLFLLEMIRGRRLEFVTTRFRRGGGVGEVRKKLPLLLASIRRMGLQANAVFTVAVDNDRALEHPAHEAHAHTTGRTCRYCDVLNAIHAALPNGWPIPGAVAVPVQMIETWLLLLHDPLKYRAESELPVCARRDQAVAIRHYGPNPPPQLKDLVEQECKATGKTKSDFALDCVLRLDIADLAARSPSFALFHQQVAGWPP